MLTSLITPAFRALLYCINRGRGLLLSLHVCKSNPALTAFPKPHLLHENCPVNLPKVQTSESKLLALTVVHCLHNSYKNPYG